MSALKREVAVTWRAGRIPEVPFEREPEPARRIGTQKFTENLREPKNQVDLPNPL